jgi:hypothetical protein
MRIGLSPARYMEEYLAVLHPLFSEGRVDFAGQVSRHTTRQYLRSDL